MPLAAHLSPTILVASLNQVAPLLQKAAKTDELASRQAATAHLEDYNPQTNQELALAGEIIHYRALAADNMMRSQDPELPLTKVLRLRGNGVSLSREAHKAQRKLDKLQSARTQEQPAQPEPVPVNAPPTQAERAVMQTGRDILAGKAPHKLPTAEQLRKQALTQIMRDNIARNAAKHASQAAGKAAQPA